MDKNDRYELIGVLTPHILSVNGAAVFGLDIVDALGEYIDQKTTTAWTDGVAYGRDNWEEEDDWGAPHLIEKYPDLAGRPIRDVLDIVIQRELAESVGLDWRDLEEWAEGDRADVKTIAGYVNVSQALMDDFRVGGDDGIDIGGEG